MANIRTSSFQKKGKGQSNDVTGTKPSVKNSQLLISSGVSSLDNAIGGGFPVGSLVLVEEDQYGGYSNYLMKYFLAEGLVCGHALFVGSQDMNSKQLVQDLPAPVSSDIVEDEKADSSDGEMTIAWRYQNLKTVSSQTSSTMSFGHFYDLSKKLSTQTIDSAVITHWDGGEEQPSVIFKGSQYGSLLESIEETLKTGKYFADDISSERNILRIGLLRLGSPLWFDDKHLYKFLYCLRALLRKSFATCLVTLSSHLFQDVTLIRKCIHLSDICVRLQSFTGTSMEKSLALKDYHGLFHITKVAPINSLASFVPKVTDLAFKLRKKKFVIEKLHLPPELEDSTGRAQEEAPTIGCASTAGNRLDF